MTDPFLILLVGIVALVVAFGVLRLHAFLALLLAAAVVFLVSSPELRIAYEIGRGVEAGVAEASATKLLADQLNHAFGTMAGRLGLLIALASIVASGLFHSGAAQRLIRSLLKRLGEKRAPAAFSIGAFSLGIPSFSDTVLYLMLPLARATALRTGRNYLLYVLVIAIACTTTSGFVPPTPGPLFAAAAFNLDFGLYLPISILAAAIAVTGGFFVAHLINARMEVPVRPTPDASLDDMRRIDERSDDTLPPMSLSLVPLFLPLILISLGSVVRAMEAAGPGAALILELAQPVVALALGAAVSIFLMVRYGEGGRAGATKQVGAALQSAGIILLITAAGGVFGVALQTSNIGGEIVALADRYEVSLLLIGFLISTLIAFTTGSGTVAVVTTVGIMAPIVAAAGPALAYNPIYIALAIGSGGKMFPWMNNSFFWLLCEAGGLTPKETLKSFSVLNSTVGIFGLATVFTLAELIPAV